MGPAVPEPYAQLNWCSTEYHTPSSRAIFEGGRGGEEGFLRKEGPNPAVFDIVWNLSLTYQLM